MSGSGERRATVTALSVTPVKGTRIHRVAEIAVDRRGAADDRRFFVTDDRGRMVNGKVIGELQAVVAQYDGVARRLSLALPDGRMIEGAVTWDGVDGGEGSRLEATFFSRPRPGRPVAGPFSAALSELAGRPLRLWEIAEGRTGADRGVGGAVSLVSTGSLRHLGELAAERGATGGEPVDPRRFRMLVEVDGVAPHEEDGWVGRTVRLGAVEVRFAGHVGRCLITSRDPDTGAVDLPTLDLLGAYRREIAATEPLPFGIYGEVRRPGTIAVGDPVAFAAPAANHR